MNIHWKNIGFEQMERDYASHHADSAMVGEHRFLKSEDGLHLTKAGYVGGGSSNRCLGKRKCYVMNVQFVDGRLVFGFNELEKTPGQS